MPEQDSSSEGELRDQRQDHSVDQRGQDPPERSSERDQRRRRSHSPRESRRQNSSRSPSRPQQRRSRSRSPDRQRRRSRSPRRRPEGHRKKEGGFRWKEKRRPDDEEQHRNRDSRLERGYQSHYRPNQRSDPSSFPDEHSARKDEEQSLPKPKKSEEKKKKKVKIVVEEPMITVTVNDRLGTKAAIKCFGSDPLPLFKAQVAARIGRRPHEILLKRQGERALTGNRTLDDYLVSDGVQLDLEVDTGD